MKLSEALRKGSVGVEQVLFDLLETDCRRCALGAILKEVRPEITDSDTLNDALLELGPSSDWKLFMGIFPQLTKIVTTPHVGAKVGRELPLWQAIEVLNDSYRFSFEQIANWLESIGE